MRALDQAIADIWIAYALIEIGSIPRRPGLTIGRRQLSTKVAIPKFAPPDEPRAGFEELNQIDERQQRRRGPPLPMSFALMMAFDQSTHHLPDDFQELDLDLKRQFCRSDWPFSNAATIQCLIERIGERM